MRGLLKNRDTSGAAEMSAAFFEDTLEALGCERWYRNAMVSEAIDAAWTAGHRTVGANAAEVLKSSLMIRRLVGGK